MNVVEFSPDHIDAVQPGYIEQDSTHADAFRAALREHPGPAYSLCIDGRIVGCAGILVARGEGWTWVWLSDEARRNPVGLTKTIRALSERHAKDYAALYGMVRTDRRDEMRWLQLCGYEAEDVMKLPDAEYMRFRYGH